MNIRDERVRIVGFTVLITAFFGFLMTGVEQALASRKEMNAKVSNQKVILGLFGMLPSAEDWPGTRILDEFSQKIELTATTDSRGKSYSFFRLKPPAQGKLFVFPFKGQGFWDAIHGFLAIDAASNTVTGIEFTEHGETPGLGGRISETSFKARFPGRTLTAKNDQGKWFTFVSEGSARPDQTIEVDGITGATETSRSVETMLNQIASEIRTILKKEEKP